MKELSTHMHVQMQFLLQPLNACMAFTVESWCVCDSLCLGRHREGGHGGWKRSSEWRTEERRTSAAGTQINCLPGPCGHHSHQTSITSLHKDTWLLLVTCEIIRVNHLTSFWRDHITEAILFFLGISSKTNLRWEKGLFLWKFTLEAKEASPLLSTLTLTCCPYVLKDVDCR